MKKDKSICFRACVELHEALIQVSAEDRRSVSSTINIILADYLEKRKALGKPIDEKRQFPREILSIPAVIDQGETQQIGIAALSDVSLGGLKISMAKDMENRPKIDFEGTRFDVIFSLPLGNKQIRLACEARSVIEAPDTINVGAAFVDADFENYQTLQKYLM